MQAKAAGHRVIGILAAGTFAVLAGGPLGALGSGSAVPPADQAAMEAIARTGDAGAQREHVWALLADLTRPVAIRGAPRPLFDTWHGEGEVFGNPAPADPAPGIEGFYRTDGGVVSALPSDVPVLTYTLYNAAAYQHILANRLNERSGLDALLATGPADETIPGDLDVPQFPTSAMVMKTVWWPVAAGQLTAMPVWDAEDNPALSHGNPYTSWHRVVGIAGKGAPACATARLNFAGTVYPDAPCIPRQAFYDVPVDADLAQRLTADPTTAKAMLIALGRPLAAGDDLVLVGMNLATREIPEWIWVTAWWHDKPDQGPFAAGRPETVVGPWRNYLMQAAFDTMLPAAGDGGPHVAFNPWLEGRFPDGGQGPGLASNCMACHARASYPPVPFLPVTRGAPDIQNDQAYAPGRLRTSFLWSLAMHAKL